MRPKPEETTDAAAVRRSALDLLARREHGRHELLHKLLARGFDPHVVDSVLDALESDGLLSDVRFVEQFVRARFQRGSGLLKFQAELRARGVDSALIERALESLAEDWQDLLRVVREKKFGSALPGDARERGRQARFLQQRGFTMEQIGRAFRGG